MQGIKIFVILVILLSLLGCDVLLAPRKPRNNPYDEENQLPLKINLNPRLEMNGGEYKLFIGITNETDTRDVKGYLLIKNRIAPPVNVFDGQCVYSIPLHEMSNDKGLEDSHLQTGNDVYYGIWAYGGENTDDYLDVDENGNIVETSMQYSGPRLITARWAGNDMFLNLESAGFVSYPNNSFTDFDSDLRPAANTEKIYSLLKFNSAPLPQNILQATLSLSSGNVSNSLTLDINLIESFWEPTTIDNAMVIEGSFINPDYHANFSINNGDSNRQFSIDITNIVTQWANDPSKNNGILLYNPNPVFIQGVQLMGISAPADKQPTLRIMLETGFNLEY